MDRIGVQLDQTILDRQGLIPSSKGLISTNDLIFYLANRFKRRDFIARAGGWGGRGWWRAPNREPREDPLRTGDKK